ncbi:MAG: hypothetical protein SH809_15650 [Rhodothermales bacterium]|nr:hypothetical protein [Rhodothermales bacterium]
MTPLFKKLNLGAEREILVLNAPLSFENELAQLEGVLVNRDVIPGHPARFAIAFAMTQAALDAASNAIASVADGDAVVWIAYPKGTSKTYRCEFNRDTGWTVLGEVGYEPVRQVAIDEDWSALRFRKTAFIKSLKRNSAMAISAEGKKRTGSY